MNKEAKLIVIAIVGFSILPAFVGFTIYQRSKEPPPCFKTMKVDGKECRVISVCTRHVPTHHCHAEVTCVFEGQANGGVHCGP